MKHTGFWGSYQLPCSCHMVATIPIDNNRYIKYNVMFSPIGNLIGTERVSCEFLNDIVFRAYRQVGNKLNDSLQNYSMEKSS